MDIPFDTVIIEEGGNSRRLGVDEFLALPIHERVTLLLQGALRFFAGSTPVEKAIALRSLRSSSTRASA